MADENQGSPLEEQSSLPQDLQVTPPSEEENEQIAELLEAQAETAQAVVLAPPSLTPQLIIQQSAPPSPDSELMTKGQPTDPDVQPPGQSQWHLVGTWGLHADQVWNDYTGQGVLVAVLDDGFQYTHHELVTNYRTDIDLDTLGGDNDPMIEGTNKHGTAVIGTIVADDNGSGSVGVAFDADAFGIRQGFGAQSDLAQTLQAFQYALAQDADVINNSWGFTAAFADDNGLEFAGTDFYQIRDEMINMVDTGRGGLGMNIVFSGGNARTSGENVNYHNLQNSPYGIAVGAIYQDGTLAPFSNPGAALLVSAGGTAIWTTDNMGASGYMAGDYTNFSGTSASAPIVSGLIALMLEANADLGWRDVQEILAYSAQHNDSGNAGWQYNGAGNWNGGGLHFSHDFGYGAADAFRAVRLAETWDLQQTSANMTTISTATATPALNIPATGTVQTTINVAQDIEIEHILIDLDIDHTKAGDLIVTLISPDGTESVLVDRIQLGNFTTSVYGFSGIDFQMSSTAHWGESSAGTWTLRIEDAAAGNSGILNSWKLTFMGNNQSADDLYVFTNDFGNFAGAELAARSVITDTDGGTDTVNLATVTSNSTLNLNTGTGTIAGKAVTVAGGTVIEKIYGGDGNDVFTGNAANNYLFGGRGDDTLQGMDGNDTLDGSAGTDTAVYGASYNNFSFNFVDATRVEISDTVGSLGDDILLNIENFTFTEGTYTRAQLEALVSAAAAVFDVDFFVGANINNYLITSNGSVTLDNNDLNLRTVAGNIVQYTRNNTDLTINYLHLNAPRDLNLTGSAQSDNITVSGIHSGLVATIDGGGGNDTITLTLDAWSSNIHGGLGNDTITGSGGRDTLYGDTGNDTLNGGANYDWLYGGDGDDTLNGGDGLDRLYGGNGADILNGDGYKDYLYGEAGDDTLNGGAGDDTLYGGDNNDTLNGDDGRDLLYGDAGDDILNGGNGYDRLYGGIGNDTLNGGANGDILYGQDGTDTLNGDAGEDYLYGGNGDDILNGGLDRDYLYGEAGNDTLNGGAGSDLLYGGIGNDTLNGDADTDQLNGDAGDDRLNGGDGNDILRGGADNDTLFGDAGDDRLYGDAGADTLVGGAGRDLLYGGTGNDVFGFTVLDGQIDVIQDFAAGDKFNITDILSGFTQGVDDINDFVMMTGGSLRIFYVDSDGGADNFVAAFRASGAAIGAQSVQDLLDAGTLITNQTLL